MIVQQRIDTLEFKSEKKNLQILSVICRCMNDLALYFKQIAITSV